jgi:hypothetical protein
MRCAAVDDLQSANAVTSQPGETAQQSANIKAKD